ncbi:MAG TPA: cupin domain-containing protein [Thermoanaerobaculia bacterium]|nr:cupin domain-containing protein [Thermoanaerobaculia bacterium]
MLSIRRTAVVVPLALAAAGLAFALAEAPAHDPDHILVDPAQIVWKEAPAILQRGAQIAVLKGDPGKESLFVLRLKMPDGYRISPHWHPATENVTVIQGVFNLGAGEQFDPATATAMVAGAFTSMPAKMRHYAFAKGETIVQLHGVGPWQLYYVNPEDDPSRAAAKP